MAVRKASLAAVLLAVAVLSSPVRAASTLDAIRALGFVRCAGVPRPGLAAEVGEARWEGLEVEVCRAIAVAVLGERARIVFRTLGSGRDFDGVRAGADQVAFLTFDEMRAQRLTDRLLPGPPVFLESHRIMVAEGSPAKSLADLGGLSVCSLAGTPAEASLDEWAAAHALAVRHRPFSEDGEMFDAFRVQSCEAVVGESTMLARERLDSGINHLAMRLLPGSLHDVPVVAATPLAEDAGFAAIVAWTIHTLVAADAAETTHRAGGLASTPVAAAGLGLREGWQKAVVDGVGSYAAVFRRTLGAGSPLRLEPGVNAGWPKGALVAPSAD